VDPRSPSRIGPAPRLAVARELARAAGALALLPIRAADFALRREALRRELLELIEAPAPASGAPEPRVARTEPLRLFVSSAEASGEIHAANFVAALRGIVAACGAPPPEIFGLGGARLAARGVEIAGDPGARAAMGFDGALSGLPYYLALLERCARELRERRPHVAVLIDSPALHVPLAHVARRYGVPVAHFVTPQYWGWAPWRVASYARAVDLALTILPFEPEWFARRGVRAAHVGHPLLDELAGVATPSADPPGPPVLALLPGSRAAVIERNLPWMLDAARRVRARLPEVEVEVVQGSEEHRERIESLTEASGGGARSRFGDLHGALSRARAALSVSGTVLLDLAHHRIPSVCIYRVGGAASVAAHRHGLSTPWFASVNLLAGREVVPEHCFAGRGPLEAICGALERCLTDEAERARQRRGFEVARERLGPPGACARAARHVLGLAAEAAP
jgi:lipid-A-disaccharide synthase